MISRSVATDKFSGRELAKMLALIGAINGIAPVAAPIVGGTLTGIIAGGVSSRSCWDWA